MLLEPDPVREMVQRWWDKLPEKFSNIETDAFVIMPNHIHGIIIITGGIVGVDPRVNPDDPHGIEQSHEVDPTGDGQSREIGQSHGIAPTDDGQSREIGQSHGIAPTGSSLSTIVQWFKTMTTNEYIRGVKQLGWTPFPGKLWQRNYWEHIVRNDDDLTRIQNYIQNNPRRWAEDRLHPTAPPFPGESP